MSWRGWFNGALRRADRLLILGYENIAAGPRPGSTRSDAQSIDRSEFDWQMKQLLARVQPISVGQLAAHVRRKRELFGPQACVTIDCDSRAVNDSVLPILRQLELVATFGVEFDRVDDRTANDPRADPLALDWDAIRSLVDSGMDLAHHVRSGSAVMTLEPAQRRANLAAVRQRAKNETGMTINAWVYPGNAGATSNLSLLRDAALAGFSLGVNGSVGSNPLRPFEPMSLRRVPVTSDMTRTQFQKLLDGLGEP